MLPVISNVISQAFLLHVSSAKAQILHPVPFEGQDKL